jgi:hypothetical protein
MSQTKFASARGDWTWGRSGIHDVVGVTVNIRGAEEVEKRFRDLAGRVRSRLAAAVDAWARVVATEAAALAPKKSGRLARSLSVLFPRRRQTEDTITAVVRAKTRYAPVIEFGKLGNWRQVKEYPRTLGYTRIAMVTASGKTRMRKVAARGVVRAHSRHMTGKSQPFLGTAFERLRPQIESGLARAVEKAIVEA